MNEYPGVSTKSHTIEYVGVRIFTGVFLEKKQKTNGLNALIWCSSCPTFLKHNQRIIIPVFGSWAPLVRSLVSSAVSKIAESRKYQNVCNVKIESKVPYK